MILHIHAEMLAWDPPTVVAVDIQLVGATEPYGQYVPVEHAVHVDPDIYFPAMHPQLLATEFPVVPLVFEEVGHEVHVKFEFEGLYLSAAQATHVDPDLVEPGGHTHWKAPNGHHVFAGHAIH